MNNLISAVIAEFNPFHNGHAYLLNKARENSEAVIAVMSGNFVQRGDIAIYPKHLRTMFALKNGADMVITMPAGWSMSGAENFALGGISLLKNTKIVDRIVFGCETDKPRLLLETANLLSSTELNHNIKLHLSDGINYAAARQNAVKKISESCANILTSPNNILGVEYILAMKKLNFTPETLAVKRIGADHDSQNISDGFTSASNIRRLIYNNCEYFSFVPQNILEEMRNNEFSDISLIDNALLFKLKSLSLKQIQKLPDISEGIENRIFEAIKYAQSIDDLCKKIKTKRYTYSRIRRIILSACFGIDASYLKNEPPYIQVIGMNCVGKTLLSEMIKRTDLPVIVSNKDIKNLSGFGKEVFEKESIADDLYGLAFKNIKNSGTAYTMPIIKINS